MGQQLDLVADHAEAAAVPRGEGAYEPIGLDSDAAAEQRRLPLPIHLARPLGDDEFAHPAEVELARIFSFYRVRWIYEPTTFHLEVDDEGRPLEQVTPDFYLPDHDIYVELTTMRQSLVTRKNRKIRRLKEAFPTLHVKLLYRKDYYRLIGSYLTPTGSEAAATPGKPLFSEKQIQQRISALAGELIALPDGPVAEPGSWGSNGHAQRTGRQMTGNGVHAGNAGEPSLESPRGVRVHQLIGLGSGSRRFLSTLETVMRTAGARVDSDWLSLTRYAESDSNKRVRIGRRPRLAFAGKDVTLVADVISTGLSAAFAMQWLERHGASSVRVCTLLDREDARILDVPIAHAGFQAPNDVLVGFGIPFMSQYDDLPHIAPLKTPPKPKPRPQPPE